MRGVKKQSGFTLIEIIVSITLIPLLWFAIYTALSVNTMLTTQAKHRAQAVFTAQQNLDRMRTVSYATLPAVTAHQAVTIDNRGTAAAGDDLTGTIASLVAPVNAHCRQVIVTVNWNERVLGAGNRAMSESLATIISDDSAG